MFVSLQQFRRNPKTIFYDKSVPKGSEPKGSNPVLDCCNTPKGTLAYKNFSDMLQEKNFVDDSAHAKSTQQLLSTISDFYANANASEYIEVQNLLIGYLHDHQEFKKSNNELIQNIIFLVGKQNYFITKIQEQFNNLKN